MKKKTIKEGIQGLKVTTDTQEDLGKAYPLASGSVCKQDMLDHVKRFPNLPFTEADIMSLDEGDMEWIARKMSDIYIDELFWESMESMVECALENK